MASRSNSQYAWRVRDALSRRIRQHPSVGDDAPQVLFGAVQEFLHETVRRFAGGSWNAFGTRVNRDPPSEQVNRDAVFPLVTDRIVRVSRGKGVDAGQAVKVELFQEGPEPPVSGDSGRGPVLVGTADFGFAEVGP